jgi:hypothetical protein
MCCIEPGTPEEHISLGSTRYPIRTARPAAFSTIIYLKPGSVAGYLTDQARDRPRDWVRYDGVHRDNLGNGDDCLSATDSMASVGAWTSADNTAIKRVRLP